MKEFYIVIFIITICICVFGTSHSAEVNKCIFGNDAKNKENEQLMNVISSFVGQSFMTEKDGYSYKVSICKDISKENEFGTVTRSKNKENVVLGRRNDTRIVRGNSWLVLMYGSGDFSVAGDMKNLTHRRASIYFVCDPDCHDKSQVELIEEDGRNYKFILPTSSVCTYKEELSGFKLFIIIVAASLSIYCLIGISYKRYVYNSQRCQQIPHFNFWRTIGSKLADGCDYLCRCNSELDDSWNNAMSNFESGDRDDALLRP